MVFGIFSVVPLVVLIGFSLSSGFRQEAAEYRLIDWLSLVGLILGYMGLVASAYAALGVKKISDRYFAKARLPVLTRNISGLAIELASLAETPARHAVSSTLFPNVSTQLAALQRVRDYQNKKLVVSAIDSNKKVKEWVNSNRATGLLLNACDDMWKLYGCLYEISSELSTKIEEDKAR